MLIPFRRWWGPGKTLPLFGFLFGLFSFVMAFVHTFGAAIAVRFRESRFDSVKLGDETRLTPLCASTYSPRHYRECSLPRHQLLPVAILPQRRAGLPLGRSFFGHRIMRATLRLIPCLTCPPQACFLVCTAAAGAVGGLLASGILKINSIGWLTEWR